MPRRSSTTSIPRRDLTVPLLEIGYDQKYVGLQVMPGFPVFARKGVVPRVPMEALRQNADTKRSKRGRANRVDWKVEDFSYELAGRWLETALYDEDRRDYGEYFDLDLVNSSILRNAIMIQHERAVSAAVFNTTTFPLNNDTGLDTAVTWATYATAVPHENVAAAKVGIANRCGYRGPLTAVMNKKVFTDLTLVAAVREQIKYTGNPGIELSEAAVAKAIGVENIIVAEAVYNTADEGQTPAMGQCWSDSYCWVGVINNNMQALFPCVGRTLYWDAAGGLFEVDQYREEGETADVLRVHQFTQELSLNSEYGFLLKVD